MLKYLIFCSLFISASLIGMELLSSIRQRPISVCGTYDTRDTQYNNDPTWTDLHQAAYNSKDPILLRQLISQAIASKGTVDIQDKFGQTPLWWAAHRGNKEAVALLLEYGANAKICDMFKRSAKSKIEANPTLKPLLNPGIKP